MAVLLLAALLTVQGPFDVQPMAVDDGPTILIHRQASPLVALRLSVPVPDGLPEGTVELLQELARPDARAAADVIGAAVELRREGNRAIITATGPATAFDALAAILRRAISEPDLTAGSLRQARARAEGRVLASLEQPGPRVHRLLRHRLYGGPLPSGAPGTRLTPEEVRRALLALYRRSSTRIVLVGSVPEPVVRSAFAAWPRGADSAAAALPSDTTDEGNARPQAHREWGGIAFVTDADPAVLAVTAALVQRRVDRSALRYGTVESWLQPHPALILIGAAMPDDSVIRTSAGISRLEVADDEDVPSTDVRRYLRRLVAEAAALAGENAVATARARVRRDVLMEARSVPGKAEVIGRVADTVDPSGRVDGYLARLDTVDLEEVRALLTRVLESQAVTAEGR